MTTEITDLQGETTRLIAELTVLDEFDVQRASRGHDYGAGQRAKELSTRRRELEEARGRLEPAIAPGPTQGDLARAFNRSIMPRVQRARREREAIRDYTGASFERRRERLELVIEAARSTAARLELEIGVGS